MSGGSSAARIHQLLEQVSKLPVLNRRAIGAVVGACVADAAARPLHWLYDQEKLETYIEDRKPEFWPLSLSPYYSLQTGENSCYFDLLFVMLDSLPSSSSSSVRTLDHFKANIIKFFGPGTPYNEAYDLRPSIYDPSKRTEERQPVPGPWIQKSVVVALSSLLQNEEPSGNPESKETDGTVSSIPLIAQLAIAGTDFSTLEVQQSIKTAASVLSSNNVAILHTLSVAMTLSLIIKHGESALEQQALLAAVRGVQSELLNDVDEDMVASELMEVFNASSSESHTTHVAKWGKPCANPGSFMGAMHSVISSSSYEEAVRKVIMAGGCNCSRANLAGACLGAAYGFGGDRGIRLDWLEKTTKAVDVLDLAISKLS